jgi:hypothetical protein
MDNFSTLVNASPASYGMTAPDAASIATANTTFQNAYALSARGAPSTRSPVTVAATVSARAALTALVRLWSSQIRLNPGVTDGDKLALGLRLPNNSPNPIPKPATWPVLSVNGYGPLMHSLKFVDSSTPALKAKPYGAIGAQIFVGTGVAPIVDVTQCKLLGVFTKNYPQVTFQSGDAGKIATYFARWITRGASDGSTESNVGPWSNPVSAGIGS